MKNKLYLDYILMQLLFFVLMGVLMSYGSVALLALGYSASEIGFIMAISSLLSALLQPFVANLSDNSNKLSLFNICVIVSIISVILSTLSYVQNNSSLIMTVVFTGLLAIYSIIEPLINTIPSILENNGIKINFGVGRAIGSFGYALANGVLGILTTKFDYPIIFVSTIVSSILLLLIAIKTNKDSQVLPSIHKIKDKSETITYKQFLSNHKSFLLFMLCVGGIFFGYCLDENQMIYIVTNLGGTSSDLGLTLAYKACLEVPVIFFYDRIEKLIGSPEKVLKIAGVAFAIKLGLFCTAKSVAMLYVCQTFQLFSLSLIVPAVVSYTNKICSANEATRGQALFITIRTISAVISSLIGGVIIDALSVEIMLLIAFISTTISAICLLIYLNKKK